jgi:hypothetical protein
MRVTLLRIPLLVLLLMGERIRSVWGLIPRETLTVIPRGINPYSCFVARALDRQGAYFLRPGINKV